MWLLTNLPALLIVLNLAGDPGDEEPVGSAVQPIEQESRDVGFARVHMNRDIRFAVSDSRAQETLDAVEAAGRPESARGLPYRLEPRILDGLPLLKVCERMACPPSR